MGRGIIHGSRGRSVGSMKTQPLNLLEESPTPWSAPEFTVVVEIYEDGDPQANWQDALTINNLEVL